MLRNRALCASLFDKPLKNLKAAGFKDENHFSDVLKTDILSGITIDGSTKFSLPTISGEVRDPSWSPLFK